MGSGGRVWVLTDREKTMTSNSGEARSFSAMYLPRSPKPAMAIILRVLGIGSIAMRSCVVFLGGRAAHEGISMSYLVL